MATPREIFRSLQEQVQAVSARGFSQRVTSGGVELDRLLPGGGFARGTLVEWLGDQGSGATTLAMLSAHAACGAGRGLVVVDQHRRFYPPAAIALGIRWEDLIVVRPTSRADLDWTLTQLLRCRGVASVVCWPDSLNDRTFRRWQLAAEKGLSLGFLVRPIAAAHRPSWADLRLLVQATPSDNRSRIKVELLRSHSAETGHRIELELDDETHTLHLAPPLAAATPLRHATGA